VANLVSGDADAWRAPADEELRQLTDDMLHTEKSHMAAAARLQPARFWVGILATVLAAAAAASIVAELSKVAGHARPRNRDRIRSAHLHEARPASRAAPCRRRQLAALRVRARQLLRGAGWHQRPRRPIG
jgi:hypothetical protein